MAERNKRPHSPSGGSRKVDGRYYVWHATACLACVWVGSLLYGEVLSFWVSAWTCPWPALSKHSRADTGGNFVKVAVIADPQLTDRTTHGMKPGSFALKATQFYSDIFMRRAFRRTVLPLYPDHIIFLGDYFDGGPSLSETEFNASLDRFWHIFDQSRRGLKSSARRVPYHYLFGNHDLGYAGLQTERPELLQRYINAFGPIEHMDKIGALNFVFVDSQSLDGHPDDVHTIGSWSFFKNISGEPHTQEKKVLLSHIPLYRPDNTPCGVLRSSELINQRITWSRSAFRRIIYQNYLSEETTIHLIDLLKPVLILSGHDHDQCSVKHRIPSFSVVEHTVGSFSWQNGNLYPSFLLLSVSSQSSSDEESVSSQLCFLPYQTFIYIWYGVLFVLSLVSLFAWPFNGVDFYQVLLAFRPPDGPKAKDEDAAYDFEMVWDAEGSMHLIRKPSNHGDNKSMSQDTARSTALAQSLTKRTPASDFSSGSTSSNEQGTAESSISLVGHASKSTMSFILRKLRQITGPLVVLTTINVSFYVMLMMNDWTVL
ncbi:hypothetical protein KP509_05G034900 [Ceratopteris richardii]|uniref:Calcineurin-like phosphoesterase domain-containing protein n=1 Tax=Ceratopteris richardii TaxID=49495 RepID=A0A8T2UKS5_CERRI|nr:hypothetical protein KP509_05G034900 [Ceratopteris richardii]